MRKKYMKPECSCLVLQDLLQGIGGAWGSDGGEGYFNSAKKNTWFGNTGEGPSAPTPVGGTAIKGAGKDALELPTQNRRIWGD